MLRIARLVTLAFVSLISGSAIAADLEGAFVEHLMRQMSCANDPDPTASLLYLNRYKRIVLNKGEAADSETCWALSPEIGLRGAKFTHICASSEDALLIGLFPKLYWRGPGTSAGTGLRLVSGMALPALQSWAGKELGKGPYEVRAAIFFDGKSEISCNSLARD